MRLPFSKPYRAFPEFDGMSDEECRSYVRRAFVHRPWLTRRLPVLLGIVVLMLWPTGVMLVRELAPAVYRYVPMPRSAEWMVVWLVVTTAMLALGLPLVVRDVGVYLGVRDEVHRARCRKCGQSLAGVPVQTIGAEPDPAKQFIRCPECGKKYVLMEIGLTPRDLVPFEQRGVPPDFARKRPRNAWRRHGGTAAGE
ncbi:MAG: hypothetical protein HBSAPP03_20380 [Phycisphaerae bacterium]|nr:MAG: hypothetical protein HBSAPP03_20380 [Phycisphaerae bacterium]